MDFSTNLRNILEKKQLKQADLCRMTGIQTSLMSDYIKGKKSPAISNAILIADALNMSLDILVGKDKTSIENIESENSFELNERFKKIREKLALSQSDFGESIGLTKSSISNIENNSRNVTEKHIKLICNELNVNEKWLRHGFGEMFIENDDTIISELSNKYSLDSLDVKILESYLNLSGEQRKAIKKYVYSLVDTILEDDELYQDYREEYINRNNSHMVARNGNIENFQELSDLYDSSDDSLKK
ncbi:helix-turn-helix domain-containing protein [Clostridioides difficile]|uniref:helix-turn-helix domain-containing protein n=1 Tax=Clostridioides difficile TaxID=1496 RepID=UPI0021CDD032|nr:helix-turn-helix transcriptional regulator [Clostridioides difficile]MCU5977937.1 helix-turn-helix transcriptional regulator [Clostridioides difficile]MCU6153069.1 helix-turn-helix transcriptional regulator [Clostridioides difficile]